MLISNKDSDASLNYQVITSPLLHPQIATEFSIEQYQFTPIFAEATALAARLTKTPVAILMVTGQLGYQISSISGLAKLVQLPANPDLRAELGGLEYCYAQVMSSEQKFSIPDCQQQPQVAQSPLVTVQGVRAYLGVPIVTAAQDRLGAIAILDFKSRQFNSRDIEILQLISRLVASEFERKLLSQAQLDRSIDQLHHAPVQGFDDPLSAAEYHQEYHSTGSIDVNNVSTDLTAFEHDLATNQQPGISAELLGTLTQEFRTPLTSILGMASMLQKEIYGPLSPKQRDYLDIIHQSSQRLVEIVDGISILSESTSSSGEE